MHHHYKDIRSRIAEEPRWFDEHGVPRYSVFSPRETADIYARQCVLFHIECQSCQRGFHVCMSWSIYDMVHKVPSLEERVKDSSLHYGDPPNVECCPSGATMNSVPVAVVEFWDCAGLDPVRRHELEVPIDSGW